MLNLKAALLVLASAALVTACKPALLRYTIRIESEPSGATIYDPRTDEVIGETPYEVPVEYQKDGVYEYLRKQTAFDQYSPQDPASRRPRRLRLDSNDSVRVLVVKDGFEKLDQTIDWYFSEVDGQVVKKRVFLRPLAKPQGAADDVYR